MSVDLSSMTPTELKKLISEATREHKRKRSRDPIGKVRAKLARAAKKEGYTLEELFGTAAASKVPAKSAAVGTKKSPMAGRKVPPKYANPNDPSQTWTGRGRSPAWFAELIESGKSRDDLLIKK